MVHIKKKFFLSRVTAEGKNKSFKLKKRKNRSFPSTFPSVWTLTIQMMTPGLPAPLLCGDWDTKQISKRLSKVWTEATDRICSCIPPTLVGNACLEKSWGAASTRAQPRISSYGGLHLSKSEVTCGPPERMNAWLVLWGLLWDKK